MKSLEQTQRNNYENKLHYLVGKSIVGVTYYELKYDTPSWDEKVYHSLDFGLEIMFTQHERCYFIWGKEFTQFDVKFGKGEISKEFSSDSLYNEFDVANTSVWKDFLGKKIVNFHVNWSYYIFEGKEEEKYYYPQEVAIIFEHHRKVIISVLEVQQDGEVIPMKDHICVFFDEILFEGF